LDALFRRPRALLPYTDALAELMRPYRPEVVCGPLTGGAYVAYAVASALDVDFAWSTPPDYLVTGAVPGRRVAIVDDAINAGSAVASTAASLPAVVAVGALLTLGAAPATIAGAPVERLATLPSGPAPVARPGPRSTPRPPEPATLSRPVRVRACSAALAQSAERFTRNE
jgi:orotate phosphoribosyltransferase